MKFDFDGCEGMILIFNNGYLAESNEATQRRLKSYGFTLVGKSINTFVGEKELKMIKKESDDGKELSVVLTLFDGSKCEFNVSRIISPEDGEYIVFREKSDYSIEKWLTSSQKLYDPMMMGRAEIYRQEISKRADFICEKLRLLEESALIRKNKELYDTVKIAKNTVRIMEHHGGLAISDVSGGFSSLTCPFSITGLCEIISNKLKYALLAENYNIDVNFSALKKYGVYGDYQCIGRAVAAFLVAATRRIISSGRRGRINLNIRQVGKRVRILIYDNGIGLSEKTFERIRTDGAIPPGLEFFSGIAGVKLADAVRWIEESSGEAEISNDTGKGSVTRIYLPVCPEGYLREPHLLPDISAELDAVFVFSEMCDISE